MSNSIEFEINGQEYTVEDAGSVRSWVKGLSDFIEETASEHYTFAFESEGQHYEIDEDIQRKIADGVNNALIKHREEALKPDNPKETWAWRVRHALRQAVGLEDAGADCAQEQALDNSDFSSFREELYDIVEDYEGELADLDDVYSEIYCEIVQKMHQLDTSTELDTYGKAAIKFIFVPGLTARGSIDDFSLYLDDLQELDVESYGFDALMRLLGVDALELMEALNVDHTDTALINRWLNFAQKQSAVTPMMPVQSEGDFNLIYLLENAGARYATPMWIGELSLNDIIALNPLEDIYLSGGNVGLNDWNNGAGWVMDMPEKSSIKLGSADFIGREYGCAMECERGVISNTPPKPKKKPSLAFDDGPSW